MPEALLLETCFTVGAAVHGTWAANQFERLFTDSDDDFIKATAAEALSNHAWNSGSREKSLQLAKLSCLHFCRAGHISAALRISEVTAERLLALNRWSEGLATLAVAQHHAELLGLRTRVAFHRKQRSRLRRALGLQNQQHLHN
ncbi:hypothetical protein [Planctomicrobium piriforme]|nr:hypothetical protein [Planctomicrobium piriforme]